MNKQESHYWKKNVKRCLMCNNEEESFNIQDVIKLERPSVTYKEREYLGRTTESIHAEIARKAF